MAYRKSKKQKRLTKAASQTVSFEDITPVLEQLKQVERATQGFDPKQTTFSEFATQRITELYSRFQDVAAGIEPCTIVEMCRHKCVYPGYVGHHEAISSGTWELNLTATFAYASYDPRLGRSKTTELDTTLYTEQIFPIIEECRTLLTFLLLEHSSSGNDFEKLHAQSNAARLWISETSYSEMQQSAYKCIFSDSDINQLTQEIFGFNFDDLIRFNSALQHFTFARITERLPAFDASTYFNKTDSGSEQTPELPQRFFAPSFEDVCFTIQQFSKYFDAPIDTIKSLLEIVSLSLDQFNENELIEKIALGNDPARQFPIIQERGNTYYIVNETAYFESAVSKIEHELKKYDAYNNLKGKIVENLVLKSFEKFSKSMQVHPAVKYTGLDGERGEIDLLICSDDVAIVVEVKSGSFSEPGCFTTKRSFSNRIQSNLGKASIQTERSKQRILYDGELSEGERHILRLSHVHEVHKIVVTFQDLLALGTQPLDLMRADLLPQNGTIPWIVSLNDLRLILQLCDDPAEFIVYLRRRTDPLIADEYFSTDELDLFLEFRATGLWVDEETGNSPTTHTTMVPIRTPIIDAWHYGEIEKPVIRNTELLRYARQAQDLKSRHWLSFGATLLSFAEEVQSDIARKIDYIAKQTATDLMSHSLAFVSETKTRGSSVVVFATTGLLADKRKSNLDGLRQYLAARKTLANADRGWLAIVDTQSDLKEVHFDDHQHSLEDFPQEKLDRLRTNR